MVAHPVVGAGLYRVGATVTLSDTALEELEHAPSDAGDDEQTDDERDDAVDPAVPAAVSYTHLTLPTIYSV